MSALKKLASQTAVYGLSSILGRLLNYLLVPLYTLSFTTSEYGIVNEFYAYVAFLYRAAYVWIRNYLFSIHQQK
ncbi:MAG: hypothetical protein IPG07_11760 [Crocinitomicaceae bacterium]|nr:hypothetical protein [Crocinitomicaceae bacterium]